MSGHPGATGSFQQRDRRPDSGFENLAGLLGGGGVGGKWRQETRNEAAVVIREDMSGPA